MQPNSSVPVRDSTIEILDGLVPAELHKAAWEACNAKRWYFGHGSHDGDWTRFWKLDLDGDPAFDAIWNLVRARCEELAGAELRVVRQYANGHTYGLGGNPHLDDNRTGTYTFLYYPHLEWKDNWDGETMFFDPNGEIATSVRLRPNRGVFFDSRILHCGRAPSRLCPALRITVAFKLERVDAPARKSQPAPEQRAGAEVAVREVRREGALHVLHYTIPESLIEQLAGEKLSTLAQSVKLPGQRQNKMDAVRQRYGAQARAEAINRLSLEAARRSLPKGSVPSAVELKSGAESGDAELEASFTYLPELPAPDFSSFALRRYAPTPEEVVAAGLETEPVAAAIRENLRAQVLDCLDSHYRLPLLPSLVERELAAIWKAADAEVEVPRDAASQTALAKQFRALAERRVSLGAILTEVARRHGIQAAGAELEDKVVGYILSQARIEDRHASAEDLRALVS